MSVGTINQGLLPQEDSGLGSFYSFEQLLGADFKECGLIFLLPVWGILDSK